MTFIRSPIFGYVTSIHKKFIYQKVSDQNIRRICPYHTDGRARISSFWIPTGGVSKRIVEGQKEDAHDLLIRGGFLRQAYSGIFHMLPLGLRVQEKLEKLIDIHMRSLGASKLSLSSISSQELWEKSGRLKEGSEIFKFKDRKESRYLLAPTHEEEITALAAGLVKSYRDLPLRVYQISRKYRDEPRPRQGLLRGREFIMKDLYTFDSSPREASETYESVRRAYSRLFDELRIPYLIAAADSGNMGGNLSHEFHFLSSKGEDTIVTCSHCDQVYNVELADGKAASFGSTGHPCIDFEPGTLGLGSKQAAAISTGLWIGISKDKRTLVRGWYPKYLIQDPSKEPTERQANSHALKAITNAAGVDINSGVEDPLKQWLEHIKRESTSDTPTHQPIRVLDLYDSKVKAYKQPPMSGLPQELGAFGHIEFSMLDQFPGTKNGLNLVETQGGDKCPRCEQGILQTQNAVELGHTFYLGTRYSTALQASVAIDSTLGDSSGHSHPHSKTTQLVPMQMGCYGIGVSRMVAAVAEVLADSEGLNWPKAMAPYEVVVVPANGLDAEAEKVYDALTSDTTAPIDAVLDDRDKQLGWKLGDADLIGYPVIVVVGKGWRSRQAVEVQCRRLDGLREEVPFKSIIAFVSSLLNKI
ncbi:hypothetical protein V8E54_014209 [Elaphomyces granulatus]